jgi:hypothetical protein
MDPRDIRLIKQYGYYQARYFQKLAADPTLHLLDQIKYSDIIMSIRHRGHFKLKNPVVNKTKIS